MTPTALLSRFATLAVAVTFGLLAIAAEAGEMINTDDQNVAIKGYDPVAYFTESQPVEGDPAIAVEWQDATWQFASDENRARFVENPEQYAPRYGGFCAGGVSLGRVSDIDPAAWIIIDGKLYLGGAQGAIDHITENVPERLAQADSNWPELSAVVD